MNKKKIALIIGIPAAVIAVTVFALVIFLLILDSNSLDRSNTLYWEPEESYFVDYKITDENTVKFRYSIHFVNNSEEDITAALTAVFNSQEIKGWLDQGNGLIGCDENGELLYTEIKSGESADAVYVFEGKYLGGKVNQNLSFPEEIILMHQ